MIKNHQESILPGSPFSPFVPSLPSRPGNPGIPGKPGILPEGQVSVETREKQWNPTKSVPNIMWPPNMFAVERGDNRSHATLKSELYSRITLHIYTRPSKQNGNHSSSFALLNVFHLPMDLSQNCIQTNLYAQWDFFFLQCKLISPTALLEKQ